jgi:hypothetical protein
MRYKIFLALLTFILVVGVLIQRYGVVALIFFSMLLEDSAGRFIIALVAGAVAACCAFLLFFYHHWTTQRNSATIIQMLNWLADNPRCHAQQCSVERCRYPEDEVAEEPVKPWIRVIRRLSKLIEASPDDIDYKQALRAVCWVNECQCEYDDLPNPRWWEKVI